MTGPVADFSVETTPIEGLVLGRSKQVSDDRGTVREFFRRSAFTAAGVQLARFDQINITESRRGVIRGMHAETMTKLVTVASGAALGAYVDLRAPGFGAVTTVDLVPGTWVVIPPGVGNGFQTTTEHCQYLYCFDVEWRPGMAGSACSPLDPELGIEWPIPIADDDPRVSAKDRGAPSLADLRPPAVAEANASGTPT